ncbi:hypothetical protein Tco_1446774 [Tanacetum coccineum]
MSLAARHSLSTARQGVINELQDKTTCTDEGTGTIPGVPDVPKDSSESENDSWGESRDDSDDDGNDDNSDNNDDDDVDSNADGDNEAKYEEEYVRTPNNYEFSDDDEEYDELYNDVNARLKDVEHEEEGKRDAEMTDAGRDDVSQEKSYEQVEDDAHVTLTAAHVTQKTEGPMQSSSVSSNFASQFFNLDNVSPVDNEVVSMMNVEVHHEEPSIQTPSFLTIPITVIPEISTAAALTIPLTIPPINPLP